MRRVSTGEPILPFLTADWYNNSLPKTGTGTPQSPPPQERIEGAVRMAIDGTVDMYDPVAIDDGFSDTYPPIGKCSTTGITPFNWGIALEKGNNNLIPVAIQGICFANVTGTGKFVTYDGTELVGSEVSGRALLLKAGSPAIIFIGNSFPSGWILQTPAAGIPGRDGSTLSSADCDVLSIVSGTLVDAGYTLPVTNIFSGDIEGDAIITAKLVDYTLTADAEDCDGEPLGDASSSA